MRGDGVPGDARGVGVVRPLRMIRGLDDPASPLTPPALPAGYHLRTFRPGEELVWGRLLHAIGAFGPWDAQRTEKAFALQQRRGIGRVIKESIHFVTFGEQPVATACVQLQRDLPDFPELSWVGALAEHRGLGLGAAISLAVLHYMSAQGFSRCFLRTTTARLHAIRTFLRVGFEPFVDDPRYDADLWERILARISNDLA